MTELTLEEHLENFCPRCKTKHDSNWKFEFDLFKVYAVIKCTVCNYKIFKKSSEMTCGK